MGKLAKVGACLAATNMSIAVVAMLSTLALGVVFGWILFGKPHLITRTNDIGNVAEWVGAFATIGVGAMAWKISSHSLDHNVAEANANQMRQQRTDIANLQILRYELARVCRACTEDTGAVLTATPEQMANEFGTKAEQISVRLGDGRFPRDAITSLGEDDVNRIVWLEMQISSLKHLTRRIVIEAQTLEGTPSQAIRLRPTEAGTYIALLKNVIEESNDLLQFVKSRIQEKASPVEA